MTLGTGISQADWADLDKALKGENSEEKFPIQNMPGLCYTLLKYIMAESPGKFIIPLNVRRRVVQCECDCQF